MMLTLLKAKLHRATVTRTELDYEGSITIDSDLLQAAGIFPHEQVDVLNVNNGARFTTYAIAGAAGSGEIGVNGAAARLVQKGDLVIICAWARMERDEAATYEPVVLQMTPDNRIKADASAQGRDAGPSKRRA